VDWVNAPVTVTYSGQVAIFHVLRSLKKDGRGSVLLPAFHCPSVVEPVLHAGYRPLFYGVNRDLRIDLDDLRRQLSNDIAAVLTINYCGFPSDLDPVKQLTRQAGTFLIEDCAHSFLYGDPPVLSGARGDVGIFSFAKLVPLRVGGGYRLNAPLMRVQKLERGIGIKQHVILMKRLGEQLINNSAGPIVQRAYHAVESYRVRLKTIGSTAGSVEGHPSHTIPTYYRFDTEFCESSMPWFIQSILKRYDLRSLAARRQRNYRLLDMSLATYGMASPIFSPLPDEVVPWAYPLIVPQRSSHDFHFRGMGIPVYTFGEVLHPALYEASVGKRVLEDAEFLSRNLLMIPIHQNLSDAHMLNFAEKIGGHFKVRATKSA
jgi:dTDP-4-amino-4,6-dideoxygalactose transaminase